MKVLIACEFSGIVRDAFIKQGHDAVSCDLLKTYVEGPHYQGDVLDILFDGWDMMIAFPPCTYLCTGSMNWLNRNPEYRSRRELAVGFFMSLVNAPIEKIALENPIGHMNTRYKKPDQIVYPWMFGHPYKKDICLWLKALPQLQPTCVYEKSLKTLDFWSDKRNGEDGSSLKSITFQGVADAMADQWTRFEQVTLEATSGATSTTEANSTPSEDSNKL